MPTKKPLSSGFFVGADRVRSGWLTQCPSLTRIAWAVEPIGQHEQAENHEHDDEDVFDFHGESFGGEVDAK
jgi:hypothetical protein